MTTVHPLPREQAATEVQGLYDALAKKFGRMPNIFAVMAHRPAALNSFMAMYQAVMAEGAIGQRHQEMAYLKTSMLNGCEY